MGAPRPGGVARSPAPHVVSPGRTPHSSASARCAAALLLLFAVLLVSASARAFSCEASRAWLDACAKQEHFEARAARCVTGHAIVTVARDGETLEVDLTRAGPRAFISRGTLGLSPVGEFADWSQEPAVLRGLLDALGRCATTHPMLPAAVETPPAAPSPPTSTSPWLLGAALVFFAGSTLLGRQRAPALLGRRDCVVLVGATALVLAVRTLVFGPAFLHQNGQGPIWVETALRGAETQYGSGYAELFGAVARVAPARADGLVMLLNAALMALVPALAFLTVRHVGARRSLAWVFFGVLALEPVAARVASSESYFAPLTFLHWLAAALLSWLALRDRGLSTRFLVGSVAVGCIVAQAARVHPVGWVPSALLAGLPLLRGGPWGARIASAALFAVVTAAVLWTTSGGALHATLAGDLSRWVSSAGGLAARLSAWHGAACVVLVSVALTRPHRQRALGLLVLGLFLYGLTNVTGGATPWLNTATAHLWMPALAPAMVALAGSKRAQRRALGGALALITLAHSVHVWPHLRALPTDVLEAQWALEWRGALPESATVAYLERTGDRVNALPLRGRGAGLDTFMLTPDAPAPSRVTHYYRSSLCALPDGRPVCDAFETGHTLETLEQRTLPDRPSVAWAKARGPSVDVGLFRVTGGRD